MTNIPTVLAALPTLRAAPPALAALNAGPPAPVPATEAVLQEAPEVHSDGADFYVSGPRRLLYQGLGWTSVGMAVVGAITPGIPTTPFVILAGYFFVRSSRTAHQWLRRSRWFGPILRDWEEQRGIRRSVRNAALLLIGASMAVTLLLGLPVLLTAAIVVMQLAGVLFVLWLRVVETAAAVPA